MYAGFRYMPVFRIYYVGSGDILGIRRGFFSERVFGMMENLGFKYLFFLLRLCCGEREEVQVLSTMNKC